MRAAHREPFLTAGEMLKAASEVFSLDLVSLLLALIGAASGLLLGNAAHVVAIDPGGADIRTRGGTQQR